MVITRPARVGTNSASVSRRTNRSNGFNVGSAMIGTAEEQRRAAIHHRGRLQRRRDNLGARPTQTTINNLSTGPLYDGYVTLAPKGSPVTISAGMMASLEGYESALDWSNPVQLTTAIFFVQNMHSRGVSLNYTKGPINATVMYGDGYNTGVFNFLQALVTYTINSSNVVERLLRRQSRPDRSERQDLWRHLQLWQQARTPAASARSETFGPQFANSQLVGAYYSYTMGNLNLVPEVQYQVAKADAKLGIYKETSNFGAALFETYTFGKSPYSLGGWVEYFDSHGSAQNSRECRHLVPGPECRGDRLRGGADLAVQVPVRPRQRRLPLPAEQQGQWYHLWLRQQRQWPQQVHRYARSRRSVLSRDLPCKRKAGHLPGLF